jgi:hypothetical protein
MTKCYDIEEIQVYELVSENLTELGGPMGSEHTWTNWRKLFRDVLSAKAYAEKDYKKEAKEPEKIKWTRGNGGWHTQDLLFVMYHINKKEVK